MVAGCALQSIWLSMHGQWSTGKAFSREGELPNTFMSNKQMQKRSEMPQ